MNWHSKTPEATVDNQHEHTAPNRLAQTSSSISKTVAVSQPQKSIIQKIVRTTNYSLKETPQNISDNPFVVTNKIKQGNYASDSTAARKEITRTHDGAAKTGFFFGILGIVLAIIFVGILFALAGLVISIIGLKSKKYHTLAIIGLLLCIIGIIVFWGVIDVIIAALFSGI